MHDLCLILQQKNNYVINAMNLLKLLLSENRSQLKMESPLGMNQTSSFGMLSIGVCYKCAGEGGWNFMLAYSQIVLIIKLTYVVIVKMVY